jgi:hypothetical protein
MSESRRQYAFAPRNSWEAGLSSPSRRVGRSARVGGCHALGQTLFQHRDLNKAREVVEKGINLFDPNRHRLVNWPGGQPGEQCLLYGAFVLWMLGYPERALRYTSEAVRLANELANPANLINTLAFAATVSALRREDSEAVKYATAAIQMSEEHRNPTFLGHSSVISADGLGLRRTRSRPALLRLLRESRLSGLPVHALGCHFS